ncbi:uncharacterized protein METZ01_LOCUS504692, partial [marine metagenome]
YRLPSRWKKMAHLIWRIMWVAEKWWN